MDSRPYWVYRSVMGQHTRPTHAAMNGMVFRADDPIWRSHYPPNGFNCQCSVYALTAAEVEEEGLIIHDSADHLHLVTQDAGLDKRTGEVRQADGWAFSFKDRTGKSHVMTPDPGWSYNPGFAGPGDRKVFLPRNLKIRQSAAQTVSKSMDEFYIPKLEARPTDIARTEIQDVLASSRLDDAVTAREVKDWPLAVISRDIETAIAAAGAVTASQVVTSKIGAGKFTKHRRLDAERLRKVQDALDYGELLVEPPYIPGKQGREHQGNHYTLIAYYEEDDTWWRHVIKIHKRQLAATTVFDDHDPSVRTDDVLNRPDLIKVRPWSKERWRNRPKVGR